MRLSKYTMLIRHQKGLFIYNSLSNCLIKVDKELFDFMESVRDTSFSAKDIENSEIISDLRKAFFIVDTHGDDLIQYQAAIWGRRRTENIHNITIAPTMDCNYHCFYCFESNTKAYISEETMRRIAKYLSGLDGACVINLTWFGGEPLLAKEQMIRLTEQIDLKENTILNSSIITNGYYLDKDFINLLPDIYVKDVQLSLDGLYENYNKVKFMNQDKNCFSRILDNIDMFAYIHRDIFLNIRVNMDKNSMNDFYKISTFFKERYPNNTNINTYAAFLQNINNTTSQSKACHFCDMEDQISFSLSMFEKTSDKKYIYPQNRICECAIRNHNSWGFGPDGSVYKCWENIGNVKEKVGFIDDDGKIQITDRAKLMRYYYGADPLYAEDCSSCFYLPICHGRCPHHRIQEDCGMAERQHCIKDSQYINRYLDKLIETL